ncbi:hypothetical protein BX616_002971 [Lobosporangium transversale]|nr:hypothetical protein BX616_002971 [Lobosporangium transversale]
MPKVAKKDAKVSKRGKNEEVKKRKRKAKKDPNAPKNPMSAYLLFCEEWREKVKAQNPDSSFAKAKYATEKAAYDAKKAQDDEEDEDEESD